MLKLSFRRLLGTFPKFPNSLRNIVNTNCKLVSSFSHVYWKTWNKKQLIEYIKDNVVFESEKYIVTSLPQGVALKKTSQWLDTSSSTLEADLNEILKELPLVFNSETLILTVYPRSNASGLTIFAKSYEDKLYLNKNLDFAKSKNNYSFIFLAVVLGNPEQSFTQSFGVRSNKIEEKYFTEILQKWKDSEKIRIVGYRHKVLASSPLASLVRIEVTQDVRDCVRHILGTKCLCPVLGDVWNCVKNNSSFFGSPLVMNPAVVDINSLSLDPELLTKLNLKPGEEKLIPIHVHLHSLRVGMKNKTNFFVSVPPPESFVWTCNQLGFKEIKNYQKVE